MFASIVVLQRIGKNVGTVAGKVTLITIAGKILAVVLIRNLTWNATPVMVSVVGTNAWPNVAKRNLLT